MMKLTKIVSGGQTGADQGGLNAGLALGLQTGGWVPRGCKTLDGECLKLLTVYGCIEHPSEEYLMRTECNVRDSDGTVRFAVDFTSAGEKCTMKFINKWKRPHFDVDVKNPPPVSAFREWLEDRGIEVLNVAGNSERRSKGIHDFVVKYLKEALQGENT